MKLTSEQAADIEAIKALNSAMGNGQKRESPYGKMAKRFPKIKAAESGMIRNIQRQQRLIDESKIEIGWELWGLRGEFRDEDYGTVLKSLKISRLRADELIYQAYRKRQCPGERDELIQQFIKAVKPCKNKSRAAREIGISRQMVYSTLKGLHTPTARKLQKIRKWLREQAPISKFAKCKTSR